MRSIGRISFAAGAISALVTAQALAQQISLVPAPKPGTLFGTTGACNNAQPGGPCTKKSKLVQIDPQTGALIKTIGDVGFTVNGLAWDRTSGKLFASTSIGDITFHGLITIDPRTGAGKPVNPAVVNFGLAGSDSPVHSIAIDFFGTMVGWYDEFPPPQGVTDTFVRFDKRAGTATEFPNTGINTSSNGVAFQQFGFIGILWNIDSPRISADGVTLTQTAYVLNPLDGTPLYSQDLFPPTQVALGDFNPSNLLYYGLEFIPFDPTGGTKLNVVDPIKGTVTPIGPTVPGVHVIAFVKP